MPHSVAAKIEAEDAVLVPNRGARPVLGIRDDDGPDELVRLAAFVCVLHPRDRVGFGSQVEIRDVAMDEVSNFTIVAGDFMDLDGGQVSMASPIGRGLMGARKGEVVTIELPVGERRFKVLELVTLPDQLRVEKG